MTDHPLCAVDQRPVHDGGNLCAACWSDLDHDLTELAEDLLHDLDRVLAGLTRTGGSPIGIVVRAEKGLGFHEAAGDLLRELHNCLGGWVRVVYEDEIAPIGPFIVCSLCLVDERKHAEGPAVRPRFWQSIITPLDVRDDTADLARWLREHEREIRRHEAAGELWAEVHELVERGRRIVTPRPPKIYLGQCSALLDEADGQLIYCDADLYALDDGTVRYSVACKDCGVRHNIDSRREVMLDAMGPQKLTAVELTRAFANYGGIELKADRLRQWHHRGKIYAHPPRPGERAKRYRVAVVRRILDRELDVRKAS